MPTGNQIRAARSLINWDTNDLAKRTKISGNSINNIERGEVRPKESTIEKIVTAFSQVGVEFIGDKGVVKRDDQIVTITGNDSYIRLLEDVFHTLHGKDDAEALFFFVDNSKSPPEVVDTHHRIRNAGIKCRYLCHEKPKRLDFHHEDYRGISGKFFHNNSAVIYGDKYATMLLDSEKGGDEGALIMHNKHVAEAQRNLFNLIWSSSKKVTL